jgi:hypothetical protein
MRKTRFYFTYAEWQYVIRGLNELRNKLIAEGRYTNTVNETLYKVVNAKTKRMKVAG